MLSAHLTEALRLYRDFQTGDQNAVAQVRDMFRPTDPCFLCDRPAGDDFRLFVTEDPATKNQAILAPLCAACLKLPFQQRLARVRRTIASMFPTTRRHDVNPVPGQLLRRLG